MATTNTATAAQVVVGPGVSVTHVECSTGCQETLKFSLFNTGTPDFKYIDGSIEGFVLNVGGDLNDAINFKYIDAGASNSCGLSTSFSLGPASRCTITAIFAIVDGDPLDSDPVINFGDWHAGVRVRWRFSDAPTTTPYKVVENYSMVRVTDDVPEPSVWALMLGGFGLAGAALRRRRSTIAA